MTLASRPVCRVRRRFAGRAARAALLCVAAATIGLTSCRDGLAVPEPPSGAVRDDDLAAAIATATARVRGNSKDAAAWTNLGMVLDANGFFDEASAAYRRATELRPAEPKAWYHLAIVLERENHFEQALDAAAQAVLLAPDYPPLPRNVALWYLARGRVAEAETHARRAAELSRGSSGALLVLGRVLLEQSRDAEAAEVLEAAVMAWPPAWGDAAYARFLSATAKARSGGTAPPAAADLRGAVDPPSLPDPWRAELVPLRAGAVAKRKAAAAGPK